MEDKDIKVLGTLKKERSSKPFFVLFVFLLIIGSCFALPYAKAYFGDDFNLSDLINDKTPVTKPSSSTTTTTTTKVVFQEELLCTLNGKNYKYNFNQDGNLSKIDYEYIYNLTDIEVYKDNYQKYLSLSNSLNEVGADAKIYEGEDNFTLKVLITRPGDYISLDNNLYDLGTLYNVIEEGMKSKGFDCK